MRVRLWLVVRGKLRRQSEIVSVVTALTLDTDRTSGDIFARNVLAAKISMPAEMQI